MQKEYLLFLTPWDDRQSLASRYELDPDVTYYRAFDGSNGAEEMPDASRKDGPGDMTTPLLSAATALCDAVRPADSADKITRLKVLAASADPRWRDSVDAAIRAIEGAQAKQR